MLQFKEVILIPRVRVMVRGQEVNLSKEFRLLELFINHPAEFGHGNTYLIKFRIDFMGDSKLLTFTSVG